MGMGIHVRSIRARISVTRSLLVAPGLHLLQRFGAGGNKAKTRRCVAEDIGGNCFDCQSRYASGN